MASRLCLVTGASAGIGAALARIYASHGYDVALTARRGDRLTQLADEIRLRHGVQTLTIPADLAETGACDAIMAALAAHGREVDVLVNNAGYGLAGTYAETAWPALQAMLQVMLVDVCDLSRRVLPGMTERRFGRILNVASVAGLIPGMAGAPLYNAVKSFMVRFSQSLRQETLGAGVHVSALCPGYTYSEFHDVSGSRERLQTLPGWLWMGAEAVAAAGYEAVEANRPICVPGPAYKGLAALAKIIPDEWILALAHRYEARMRRLQA